MKCPDCQNELKPIKCKGIVINECAKCNGKWFEKNELQKVETKEDDGLSWIDFEPFSKKAEELSVRSQGKPCPKCSEKMQSLKYMESQVVIDKCPNCKGVWLDRGELAKVIMYLKNLVCSISAGELAKDTFKEFLQIFTFHKDLISEIKDLFAVFYLLELRIYVEFAELGTESKKISESTPFK